MMQIHPWMSAQAARMQAVVNQSQLRSQNSLASRSFTTTDPLSLTATRSVKLQPSIRSTDDVDTEYAPETAACLSV